MSLLHQRAETVGSRGVGFKRHPMQGHVHLRCQLAPLASITGRAGGHEIFPRVAAALPSGDDVIEGQGAHLAAAILAGVLVAPQNLALRQGDSRPWSPNHVAQFDDGRDFKFPCGTTNGPATIDDDLSFTGKYQSQSPLCAANVYRFECHV